MPTEPTMNRTAWSIIAVAAVSFSFGILLMLGVQRLLAQDPVYMLLAVFVLLPLLVVAIFVNTRRILKDFR
jgi:hypothetical protein